MSSSLNGVSSQRSLPSSTAPMVLIPVLHTTVSDRFAGYTRCANSPSVSMPWLNHNHIGTTPMDRLLAPAPSYAACHMRTLRLNSINLQLIMSERLILWVGFT